MLEGLKFLVVGAGFYGSVMAERIARVLDQNVLVIDKRPHIGGASYSQTDPATGIQVHRYGAHIFHTNKTHVYEYLKRFTGFYPYRHRVLTRHKGQLYPIPINLITLNDFYHLHLTPEDAPQFLRDEITRSHPTLPAANLEEKAISLIGEPLYRAFIEGYTRKQWGRDPKELSPDIITRLPVRTDDNPYYFDDTYQGLPLLGYDALFSAILDHPRICVKLDTDYRDIISMIPPDCRIIYTGPIDKLFEDKFGALDWRSLRFEHERLPLKDYQGHSVINEADADIPYTRIHEFKHYRPDLVSAYESPETLICREYPEPLLPHNDPYYPVNTPENTERLALYRHELTRHPLLHIGGRLGSYAYLNMDSTVAAALSDFDTHILPFA